MRIAIVLGLAVSAVLAAAPVEALIFEEERLADGRVVLWVRDCGTKRSDASCRDEQRRFSGPSRQYPGDAALLEQRLRSGNYDQVLLWSGGGNLEEGVKLGEVLRRFQATVRVPTGAHCVSACTVAFLGGLFRFVDEGATYEVHAYSAFLQGLSDRQLQLLLSGDAERVLRDFAESEHGDARKWVRRLVPYFQVSLRGRPNQVRFDRWASARPTVPYLTSPALRADVERIRREGEPAAQEILMRVERDAMAQAVDDLRPIVPELGPRAEPALAMLEAMFSSRITLTASLTHETLLKMGYVTRLLEAEP